MDSKLSLNLCCVPAGGGDVLQVFLFMSEVWLETYFHGGMETCTASSSFPSIKNKKC